MENYFSRHKSFLICALVFLLLISSRAFPASKIAGWYYPTGTSDFCGYLGWLGYNSGWGWHLAQDMCNGAGSPVYSIGKGEIIDSGLHNAYGCNGDCPGGCVLARYKAGDGTWFTAMYGHLDSWDSPGDVEAGEIIGYTRGDWNPPHLHFSIHPGSDAASNPWRGYTSDKNNTYGFVDPIPFLSSHPNGLPDLNVKRVEISPSGQENWQHSITIQSGQSFKYDIEAKVENQGEGDTDDTIEVEYYISEDKDFDKDKDSRLGKDEIDKIKSCEDETEHLGNLTAPTNPGTYYIFIYIDYDKDEEHKSNNYSDSGDTEEYGVLTVTAAPILSVTPTNYDVTPSSGSQSFAVNNTGGGTLNWTAQVTGGGSWLRITSGSSGSNSGTINCSFDKNTTTSERTGTIRVDGGGVTGSPIDLTIKQEAGLDIAAVLAIINNIILSGDPLPSCPSCSGEIVTVKDEVFYSGTDCKCVATKSLVIGPNVTIQENAKATFQSPDTKLKSPVNIEQGHR